MPKRKAPEVNAGSMADIAFLLLIFFLVTSEMSKESGMFQLLPEKVEGPPPEPVNKRNVIEVLVNNNNLILFEASPPFKKLLRSFEFVLRLGFYFEQLSKFYLLSNKSDCYYQIENTSNI